MCSIFYFDSSANKDVTHLHSETKTSSARWPPSHFQCQGSSGHLVAAQIKSCTRMGHKCIVDVAEPVRVLLVPLESSA